MDINVKVKGNVGEVECQINLNELKTIAELRENHEKKDERDH